MDRGMQGLLPRAPTLAAESALGFYESLRNFAIREMFPRAAPQIERLVAPLEAERPLAPAALARAVDSLPAVAAWKRVMRSQQQATWRRICGALEVDGAALEAALVAAERARPDRLHCDPAFETPDYARFDIHLQPGGYVGDPLAGYVFHHGTKVFYQGENDQDELHRQVVDGVQVPADGRVERVLDAGCSIGQATTALKQRFPAAEVWGLDVARPLVRYAHRRATDLGVDVHFVQAKAEHTGFPDRRFDAVLAYILFHEVPAALFDPIVAEFARVLRPGGTLTIVDAPTGGPLPAANRAWLQFDARYNCEPYQPAFVACDLPALLRRHGFEPGESGPTPSFLWRTTAVAPG